MRVCMVTLYQAEILQRMWPNWCTSNTNRDAVGLKNEEVNKQLRSTAISTLL